MQQFQQTDNKPELSHELIAGAAAYYAADKYEEHCAANGNDIILTSSTFESADTTTTQVNPNPTMKLRS